MVAKPVNGDKEEVCENCGGTGVKDKEICTSCGGSGYK
ncbi:hypothetical protein VIA_002772 [Vibrio orientalis CIP 102891 = ATCC 33934]|uniref:Chaperone protein DnaJ n=1 Tax=Vibrio orientalis CIP 102891 = ATCC 33934 TaxID=675816 RepID=A0ABM9YXH6_VIBOR|nr:hypothetical protein VIA_002772 [Vibrio orientalis CIP 102891 = ATCC 33934]